MYYCSNETVPTWKVMKGIFLFVYFQSQMKSHSSIWSSRSRSPSDVWKSNASFLSTSESALNSSLLSLGQQIEVNTTNSQELLPLGQEPTLLSCASPSIYIVKEIHLRRKPHWKTLSHRRLYKTVQRMTFCTTKRKDRNVFRSLSKTDCCPHLNCDNCPSGTLWKNWKLKTFLN